MATNLKPRLSEKNKYYVDKHRYYELKHFCLQYKNLRKQYAALNEFVVSKSIFDKLPSGNNVVDLTAETAMKKLYLGEKIKLIENAAMKTDEELYSYILRGVTEGLSYENLKARLGIPCCRNVYYENYRKFFWILDRMKD